MSLGRKVPATAFLYAAVCVIMTYSGVTYLQSVQSHGAEDLFPLTPLINREIAANVWVHPCSCAQVEALPQPLPAENVALGTVERAPLEGEKVWVVWTHLGDRFCRGRLAQVRCEAKKWETIYEGNESGLALAQF